MWTSQNSFIGRNSFEHLQAYVKFITREHTAVKPIVSGVCIESIWHYVYTEVSISSDLFSIDYTEEYRQLEIMEKRMNYVLNAFDGSVDLDTIKFNPLNVIFNKITVDRQPASPWKNYFYEIWPLVVQYSDSVIIRRLHELIEIFFFRNKTSIQDSNDSCFKFSAKDIEKIVDVTNWMERFNFNTLYCQTAICKQLQNKNFALYKALCTELSSLIIVPYHIFNPMKHPARLQNLLTKCPYSHLLHKKGTETGMALINLVIERQWHIDLRKPHLTTALEGFNEIVDEIIARDSVWPAGISYPNVYEPIKSIFVTNCMEQNICIYKDALSKIPSLYIKTIGIECNFPPVDYEYFEDRIFRNSKSMKRKRREEAAEIRDKKVGRN
uniref:Ras-GEF domain-containing protein n=1 Tax=Rhabditophanes sp. KR3021 TaxID=114890 RepID=A0AC35U465_9BILA